MLFLLQLVWFGACKSFILASNISVPNLSAEVQQTSTVDETIEEWKEWANDHAYKLTSIQPTDDFENVEMLKPLLHD
ncbi:hypothetical protein [Metasolibacillus meyeri]|uniref:hypothetical protein n=1 Tax=Metasolibacillus meyeri TaxID=1071052 RepID=UPI000D2F991D|nr:hypothetical protein [Metasolibacillus meyeri]